MVETAGQKALKGEMVILARDREDREPVFLAMESGSVDDGRQALL